MVGKPNIKDSESVFCLSSIFLWSVGESQQVSAAGGSDIPQDTGKDPGKGHEQPGNLDRLAVPA